MTDLDRLRSPDRFGAWFCGIALNVSRRWLRQLRSEVPGLLPDSASLSPGPAEAAEIADLAALVRGAVTALPNGQRHAVLLFYLQGLSHREVAGELGISVGAVKARLHQGRAALARSAPLGFYGDPSLVRSRLEGRFRV
jgi:RNA polymerase sigma-70 factor (ECF subfamily)